MRKKILLALALAVVLLVSLTGAAFAAGGDTEASVVLSDIVVVGPSGDTYYVSDSVTASGTVTITSTADAWGSYSAYATTESEAGFSIEGPSGPLDSDSNIETDSDSAWGWWDQSASSDSSQIYEWSSTFTLDELGDYTITQEGAAETLASTGWWWPYYSEDYNFNFLTISAINKPMETQWEPTFYDYTHQLDFNNPNTLAWMVGTNPDRYKLTVPEGTTITPDISILNITILNGDITFGAGHCNVEFSNPVVLSQLVEGEEGPEWTDILIFALIEDGHAVPGVIIPMP